MQVFIYLLIDFINLFIFVGSKSRLYRVGDSDAGLAGKDAEATSRFSCWYRGQRGRGHPGEIIKKIFYLFIIIINYQYFIRKYLICRYCKFL